MKKNCGGGAPAPSRAELGELYFQMKTAHFGRFARDGAGAPTWETLAFAVS